MKRAETAAPVAATLARVGKTLGGPRVAGVWVRCEAEACHSLLFASEFEAKLRVCPRCGHSAQVSARGRIDQIVDPGSFRECDTDLLAVDPLGFAVGADTYRGKLDAVQRRTGLREAAVSGSARIGGFPVELVVIDFSFLGGSMGMILGETVVRAAARAIRHRSSLVTVSASGGARMYEGVFALVQMARTTHALVELEAAGVPHISVLTNPTFGGVTASFAGIGDVLLVEPDARIGFAGPRVIEQLTKTPLPPGAQGSAALLEHGQVDRIIPRAQLRGTLVNLLRLYAGRAAWSHARVPSPSAMSAYHPASVTDAWMSVQKARQTGRPFTLDYLRLVFDDFFQLHGDRLGADDGAIVGGLASLAGRTVMVIGHQKGRTTRENMVRNFGMAQPAGYRKAMRLMRHAERFGLPLVTLIDTPGADPSLAAEEHGQAFAIAQCLMTMVKLRVPILSVVIGEGGSGGALALGVADRLLMQEHAFLSVASPEAAASILWKDSRRGREAAAALQITAPELLHLGLIDGVIPEPAGGAHLDPECAARVLRDVMLTELDELARRPLDRLLATRTGQRMPLAATA